MMSAVQFRGRVFKAECHADALQDCIECPDWPESHAEIERILEDEEEPWAFGYWLYGEGFKSFDEMETKLWQRGLRAKPGERQKAYKEFLL